MLSVAEDRRLPSPTMELARPVTGDTERCPRCGSHNTKFCYYNNYNLAQPRHFCKACRRYWTLGGSLRNVPIGGSTRGSSSTTHHHNKQPHHSSPSAPASKRRRASAAPSSVSPSPTSLSPPPLTSLAFDAPRIASISAAAPKLEPTNIVEPASMALLGSFVSLLTEPLPAGFPALGEQFLHGRDDDFELGLGFGGAPKWVSDEINFSMARPAPTWPFFVEDDGAGLVGAGNVANGGIGGERDTWPVVARGGELVGGDCGGCFGWPELAMTTTSGKGL